MLRKKEELERMHSEIKAAVMLQSHTRGWMIRKRYPGLIKRNTLTENQNKFADTVIEVQSILKATEKKNINEKYSKKIILQENKYEKEASSNDIINKEVFIHSIIKIQATIRTFLTRKLFKQPNLILCIEKIFGSTTYRLFCYYYSSKFEIKAESSVESLSIIIGKKLSSPQAIKFLRKILIPNLTISEHPPRKLIYRLQDSRSAEPQRPKTSTTSNPTKKPNKISYVPLTFTSVIPNLNISSKTVQKSVGSSIFKTRIPKPHLFSSTQELSKNSKSYFNYDRFSSSHPSETHSLSSPKVQIPQDLDDFINISEFSLLILKTGVSLSGIYVIVTMQLADEGIHIQAVNEARLVDLELFVTTKRIHGASEKELEALCSELLTQLRIVSDLDGKIALALIESDNEERNEVIYKKSHYISSRYFTVTVFENQRGVFLEAQEGDKNSFSMKLGRRRVGNSQKVQEEISDLVQKLKVEPVLGQEILVLSNS